MKPTKNHIFCHACKKYKMVFETKSKADNFLKYNAEKILEENEKAPVRSYYCLLCCGWHVTSNPSVTAGEHLDERDRELAQKLTHVKKKNNQTPHSDVCSMVIKQLLAFDIELNLCNFDEATNILNELEEELAKSIDISSSKSFINRDIQLAHQRLERKIQLFALSPEEQKVWLEIQEPNDEEKEVIETIHRINALKMIHRVLENGENLIACEDTKLVKDIIDESRQYVKHAVSGNGSNKARKRLSATIDQILEEHTMRTAYGPKATNCKVTKTLDLDEYKAILLSVISKIEQLPGLYDDGKSMECEDLLDVCYCILDELGVEDQKTELIRKQLELWKTKLKE